MGSSTAVFDLAKAAGLGLAAALENDLTIYTSDPG